MRPFQIALLCVSLVSLFVVLYLGIHSRITLVEATASIRTSNIDVRVQKLEQKIKQIAEGK